MTLEEAEQTGYDTWMDLWVQEGCSPRASQCPARYVQDEHIRMAMIRGWNKAKNEAHPPTEGTK
jgi:hypothetical protein